MSGCACSSPLTVRVVRLDPELPLPEYGRAGDAGMDLRSRVDLELAPLSRALIPTGISIEVPFGFAAFVHPRSGLSLREGLTVVNSPGTIDSGYRGEVCVAAMNADAVTPVCVSRGDRIAQLVVQPVVQVVFDEVSAPEDLGESERGTGGFGSTGVSFIR